MSFWDDRYRGADYLFGTEPADFLRRAAPLLAPGARVLFLADGEGRNSTWAAAQGLRAEAMEPSAPALEKARVLARAREVEVTLHQAGIEDWDWRPETYDAVAGIFIQFAPPALRDRIHAGIARTLRAGGLVLLHGYAPRQVGYGTGGPGAVENLYTLDGLRADFPGWEVLAARDFDAEVAEGAAHRGLSALVDFVARKPG
ncbi:class I SAM-dependent methyltransferase [Ruixingdingia sedimenti]|uniref:Class I SAM-dependent methyltransferase n=1 Tax=Ruixingdingia sedimenti TaxID=3073604 RepID=A0ABU1F8W8_9RHOB|nr:class I SAM-dependent methyltransferase [Xinfangfangia sp. LG-4]MDR5653328.1 class I SAM-dependent methyltransferase [Xinfangfangia sp. LG-4]